MNVVFLAASKTVDGGGDVNSSNSNRADTMANRTIDLAAATMPALHSKTNWLPMHY